MTIAIACVIILLMVWCGPAIRAIAIDPLYERIRALGYSGYTKDGSRRERLWHFWMRKSAVVLFIAVAAGGACMLPTVPILLITLDQFGLYVDWAIASRVVWAVLSLGFFVWMISAPPHRSRD
jgi:hypothetical protein